MRSGIVRNTAPQVSQEMLFRRLYTSLGSDAKVQAPSPHALMYRKWGKPVSKLLILSVGSYYTLFYLWEYLEKKEIETKRKAHVEV